jgi:hypothetical protein
VSQGALNEPEDEILLLSFRICIAEVQSNFVNAFQYHGREQRNVRQTDAQGAQAYAFHSGKNQVLVAGVGRLTGEEPQRIAVIPVLGVVLVGLELLLYTLLIICLLYYAGALLEDDLEGLGKCLV